MDTKRRATKGSLRIKPITRKKSVIFSTHARKDSSVAAIVEVLPGEDEGEGKSLEPVDIIRTEDTEDDEQGGAVLGAGEKVWDVGAVDEDEMEKEVQEAFGKLGMDVRKKVLDTGLEEVSISRLDGTRQETWAGTKGALNEVDHIAACRSSTSNITISAYDNLVAGDDAHIFTSLRTSLPENDGKSLDFKSMAFRDFVNRKINKHVSGSDVGTAFEYSDCLQTLSRDVLHAMSRVVTMQFYDIPQDAAVTPDERESIFLSRRQVLHNLIPLLSSCSTLVLAFENHDMLKHSNLPSFFRRTPKRAGLKIEMRIGSIWGVPVEVPAKRIESDGISSKVFAEECRELLDGPSPWGKEGYDVVELMRCRLLEKLNKVLGEGWVVPYGSRLDPNWCLTRLWKNEVWIWE